MIRNRKTTRAQRYDYTNPGTYFITICTKDRIPYFGEIQERNMKLNTLGIYCTQHRNQIPDHYPHIICDEFICMPNHIHGIIIITDSVGTQFLASQNIFQNQGTDKNPSMPSCLSGSLGAIIRGFKIGITKYARNNTIPFDRHGRYHDHIIRNQGEYERIKYYIQQNPKKRDEDRLKN